MRNSLLELGWQTKVQTRMFTKSFDEIYELIYSLSSARFRSNKLRSPSNTGSRLPIHGRALDV
jgi:hypothetical protein